MTLAVAAAPNSIRSTLRTSTASLHASVDGRMGRLLENPDGGYEQFLLASAEGVLPLEAALSKARVEYVLPDWPVRARSAALLADLSLLSLPIPRTRDLRLPDDEAFLLGVLYVLEGSRLGARLLLQHLRRTLDPKRARATHYLAHGQERRLWQSFLQRLEASRAVHQRLEAAAAGARLAFDQFIEE